MTLLRRILYLLAAVTALVSVGLVAFPGFLLETVMGQPPYPDHSWVRFVGVDGLTIALLAVLVAQRAEELWWWSWAFVVGAFGTAAVATLHALAGLRPGAAAWPWWVAAGFAWLLTFGLLRGIAGAAAESTG